MNFEIENNYGERLSTNVFNSYYTLMTDNIAFKYDKTFSQSGNSSFKELGSSQRVNKRSGSLSMNLSETSDNKYLYVLNSLAAFIDNDGPYYLVDTENSKRTEISFESIKESDIAGVQKRVTKVTINFTFLNTYWESTATATETFTNLADGDTFTISTPTYSKESPIDLVLTSLGDSNTTFSIEMTNRNDNFGIVVNEIGFNTGSIINANFATGTFTLLPDNVTINQSVTKGEPFGLIKGDNVFKYSSPSAVNVDLTITYRIRTSF